MHASTTFCVYHCVRVHCVRVSVFVCKSTSVCLYARVPLSATYQTRVCMHVCLSLQPIKHVFICTCASLCNLSNTCLYARVPLSATYQTRVCMHVCLSLQPIKHVFICTCASLCSATYQTRVYMHVCLSLQPIKHVCLSYLGLARTIYTRCTYGIFGLEITKYTVYIYVYIRFWPTLLLLHLTWSSAIMS